MSEITKLYENAGVEQTQDITCGNCEFVNYPEENKPCNACTQYGIKHYPPFIAEKQIELIKYFSNNYNISINKDNNIFKLLFINKDGIHNFYTSGVDFAEQLALFIISRYKNQILTEEEKQQVKGILE